MVLEANQAPAAAAESDTAEAVLIAELEQLARELRPGRPVPAVTLDSALESDLGLDSLGRAELAIRLETTFDVRLADQLIATAESPRDLLRGVLAAGPAAPAAQWIDYRGPQGGDRIVWPEQATTLIELLEHYVETRPDRPHLLMYDDGHESASEITYAELYEQSLAVAHGLRAQGLEPGRSVAIMLPSSLGFFYAFFGTLLAGGVPVPIYPPVRPSQLEDHLRRQVGILNTALAPLLITVPQALALARILRAQIPSLRAVVTVGGLSGAPQSGALPRPRPQDLAFMQFTSGSTGIPKGVMLSHANLMANIRAIGQGAKATPDDVIVSWLPLYHDMGLIGGWFASMYHAIYLVAMSPLTFLSRPSRWLWDIHHHRGTISAAPNFAYELCSRRLDDKDLEGLDLSSWRLALNGAETVNPATLKRFIDRFEPYGFRPESLLPVYGMAEATVGLAFPPDRRRPLIDRIEREAFARRGEAIPVEVAQADALEFVACGQPLPLHEVRIVDRTGHEVGERQEGVLEFRGPSTTSGYFRNPAETAKLFDGDWLDSGDRAYIAAGDIFITGRVKDIIIRAGRNIYPHQVEEVVGDIEGIRTGCVAVFGTGDPEAGTERLIVLAETRETDPEAIERLRVQIDKRTTEVLAVPPDDVVLAAPHTVLKTSSGKIRRSACRGLYETGRIGEGQRAVWLQVLRLALAGLGPLLRSWRHTATEVGFAAWWWLVLVLIAAVAYPAVVATPGVARRWSLVRAAARTLFALTGTPVRIERDDAARAERGIVVVNHSSYLDALLLALALPGALCFVVKKELERNPFTGLILKRLGNLFVERFDTTASLADTDAVRAAAKAGRRIVFFPEGTLTRMPGLLPFRQGAFVIAAELGLPVTPMAMRGTRSILRDGQWFPRRGRVAAKLLPTIEAGGEDWSAAIALRDKVRTAILEACGEPDLGHEVAPTFQHSRATEPSG